MQEKQRQAFLEADLSQYKIKGSKDVWKSALEQNQLVHDKCQTTEKRKITEDLLSNNKTENFQSTGAAVQLITNA